MARTVRAWPTPAVCHAEKQMVRLASTQPAGYPMPVSPLLSHAMSPPGVLRYCGGASPEV